MFCSCSAPVLLLFCSYGDRVEHFRVLEKGGQYCIWDKSFRSLNRLVDFYRSHSIDVEEVVYLRDPPLSPHPPSQPGSGSGSNPYPNPYLSSSQEFTPSGRVYAQPERDTLSGVIKEKREMKRCCPLSVFFFRECSSVNPAFFSFRNIWFKCEKMFETVRSSALLCLCLETSRGSCPLRLQPSSNHPPAPPARRCHRCARLLRPADLERALSRPSGILFTGIRPNILSLRGREIETERERVQNNE